MANFDDMTVEKFRLWSLSSLRSFLTLRGKHNGGDLDELSARSFVAWEEKISVNFKAEHAQRKLLEEYKGKLILGKTVLPDPFGLDSSWVGENDDKSQWPSVYILDIAVYLNSTSTRQLVHELMNEYKIGKGYRYFSCNLVKDVYLHNIRDGSSLCFLKAQVAPSLSINAGYYDVWVAVQKDGADSIPDAKIKSAYCTCTAGMLGSCNHIAGLLFKLEAYTTSGQTETASTSLLCQWNVPSSKTPLVLQPATDLVWTKDTYAKRGATANKLKLQAAARKSYTPLSEELLQVGDQKSDIRSRLAEIALKTAPKSRFSQVIRKEKTATEVAPEIKCHPSLTVIASHIDTSLPMPEREAELLDKMKLSPAECAEISEATVDQSSSDIWHDQRRGRLTSSSFHRFKTRMDTVKHNPSTDTTAAVAEVMGYNKPFDSVYTKHGKSCEPHAKKAYISMMKSTHKRFKSFESGMHVCKEHPFLSASPDLLTICECCGEGLCEVKCPHSLKNEVPTVKNVRFIHSVNGVALIKVNDRYHSQIQGQMGITGRTHCDLFVYTFHGYQCIRVDFDEEFYVDMLHRLETFWMRFVLPELLTGDVKVRYDKRENVASKSSLPSVNDVSHIQSMQASSCSQKSSKQKTSSKGKHKRSKKAVKVPVHLCVICTKQCLDEPELESENCVQCDNCDMWCHFMCVGIHTGSELENDDDWICPKCLT